MFVKSELHMISINFEILRPKWPELAGLGGFAEAYAHSDAVGSISKLRVFCEQVVEWIHDNQRLPKPYQANLHDLLNNPRFKEVIDPVILSKLHALRMEGNKAVHGNKAGHADPRTTRLYDRRQRRVTRNIVERISI